MRILNRRTILAALILIAAAGGGYAIWQHKPAEGGDAPQRGKWGKGPIPVLIATAQQRDMPVYLNGLGTVQAYNSVTVHSRVDGELVDVGFKEGQNIHSGDLLARIDPRSYQAQLEQAQAAKDKDVAQLEQAKLDLQRYLSLGNRVTGQSVDSQKATVKQLEAAVRSDQAAIDSARTSLSYTTIFSPIDGRAGLRLVDKGNIIHSSDSTGLVVIAQLQPISVIFTLPQQNLLAINDQLASQTDLPVSALDADGKTSLDEGRLELVDNQIDQTTGTMKLKAVFPNAQNHLWPGGFVNVRLLLTTRKNALVVPTPAIQRGPKGTFVYLVKDDQSVEMRLVKVAFAEGENSLIEDGLAAGETVVVEGVSRLQEGSKVTVNQAGNPAGQGNPTDAADAQKKPHKHKDRPSAP